MWLEPIDEVLSIFEQDKPAQFDSIMHGDYVMGRVTPNYDVLKTNTDT